MIELLLIYKWSIISGIIVGSTLALVGAQLASRNESIKSFLLSQAAALGILIALMIEMIIMPEHQHELGVFPMILGFITASLMFYIFDHLKKLNSRFKNSYFLSIYVVFLAIESICVALVPNLDSHSKNSYIGDISLVTNIEAQFISAFALIIFIFIWKKWLQVTHISFLKNTFDQYIHSSQQKKLNRYFTFATIALITLSIELLGMLFTLSCLFIPIVILSGKNIPIIKIRSILTFAVTLGVTSGVLASFGMMKLPTVPAITIFIVFASYLLSRRSYE